MKTLKNMKHRLLRSQSGQGATEYILLLVIVVAVAMMFKKQIIQAISGKVGQVEQELQNFNP